MTQHWMMRKLEMTPGLFLESSCGTPCQTVRADGRIIPKTLKKHWRYQKYRHHVRCDVGESYWKLLECWWRERIVRYVDWFHKIHFIEWETTWWISTVREETDEKANDLQARQIMARNVETYVWCIKTQRKAKVGCRETKTW